MAGLTARGNGMRQTTKLITTASAFALLLAMAVPAGAAPGDKMLNGGGR